MNKQTDPLETDTLQKSGGASRGMLGRIRKATGDFDFSALISGSRRQPVTKEGTEAPGPTAYNPLYQPDPDDTVPSLSKLWEPPPTAAATAEEPAQVLEWERAKHPPTPSGRPYSSIYAPIDDEPAYVRVARARGRRKRRLGYGRAVFTRTLLCLWAILFGVCLGAGGGPLVERFSEYRAVPASMLQSLAPKPSKPAPKPSRSRRGASSRRSGHLAPSRSTTAAKPAAQPDAWRPYRELLAIPLAALAAVCVLWMFGLPDLFGDYENSGYWALALATFGLAAWCGTLAMMATLEIRSVRPPVTTHGRIARVAAPTDIRRS